MTDSDARLTLEGLAQVLRDHMDGTAARFAEVGDEFAEVRAQFAEVGARLDAVGTRIERLANIVGDLTQIVARHHDELAEHRQFIRQVFARMEQHDARFEAMTRDIRRILDAMEGRGGDGGRRA